MTNIVGIENFYNIRYSMYIIYKLLQYNPFLVLDFYSVIIYNNLTLNKRGNRYV